MTDKFYLPENKSIQSSKDAWYQNVKFIGKGGNGTAFLVMCTNGEFRGQIFALKILHRISEKKRIQRFLDEVEFLKNQNHPSLLNHYDDGVYYKRPFLVMNYMPNTLEQELRRGVSLGDGLIFSTQLLSAIKCLHETNIVHRDIKPSNIFINNKRAVLGDFGLIKNLNENREEYEKDIEGYIAMPKFYRTPELVEYAKSGQGLTTKSDIFQLGLVLCNIFTNQLILKPCDNLLDEIKLHKIGRIKGKFGGWIAQAIKKMTDMNPDKRPSAEKLLDDFTGIFEEYAKERMKLEGEI